MRACYWLVGMRQKTFPVAVAVDLHTDDGELIGETWAQDLKPGQGNVAAYAIARSYAAKHGVPHSQLSYDKDSTEFFAKD
jgi:hypothetical protein